LKGRTNLVRKGEISKEKKKLDFYQYNRPKNGKEKEEVEGFGERGESVHEREKKKKKKKKKKKPNLPIRRTA